MLHEKHDKRFGMVSSMKIVDFINDLLVLDLCHDKEWITSHCCINPGFLAGSNGWGHTLVYPHFDEKCQHLQISNWEVEGAASWHCRLCCYNGHSWYVLCCKIP